MKLQSRVVSFLLKGWALLGGVVSSDMGEEEGGEGCYGWSIGTCLLLSFHLSNTRYVRYFTAISCMWFRSFLISFGGILRCFNFRIKIAPLTPLVIVMRR